MLDKSLDLSVSTVREARRLNNEKILAFSEDKEVSVKKILKDLQSIRESYEDGVIALQDVDTINSEIEEALKKFIKGLRKHYELQESLFKLEQNSFEEEDPLAVISVKQEPIEDAEEAKEIEPAHDASAKPVDVSKPPVTKETPVLDKSEIEDIQLRMSSRGILPDGIDNTVIEDSVVFSQIKEDSRKSYVRAFKQLRDFLEDQLETRPPSEQEMLAFIQDLRERKEMASSSLWTIYSMINSVVKIKHSLNMKVYSKVIKLLKSFDSDVKKKTNVFTMQEIHRFVLERDSTPYWLVRRAIVSLAYYGGLRQTEIMTLQVEMCESAPEGVYVTHKRVKSRGDKGNSKDTRFLVPRHRQGNSCADVLDSYLDHIKENLHKHTGRLLWTGTASTFINTPMGRNTVSKVPSDMAKKLGLNVPPGGGYTFNSFRRAAAVAVADAGASSTQMMDLFGWSNSKVASELINSRRTEVCDMAAAAAARRHPQQQEEVYLNQDDNGWMDETGEDWNEEEEEPLEVSLEAVEDEAEAENEWEEEYDEVPKKKSRSRFPTDGKVIYITECKVENEN